MLIGRPSSLAAVRYSISFAVEIWRKIDLEYELPGTLMPLARAYLAGGEHLEEARDAIAEARNLAEKLEMKNLLKEIEQVEKGSNPRLL